MLKCDFNNVAKQFEITLRHGCSAVNLLHIFRKLLIRTPLDGCFWENFQTENSYYHNLIDAEVKNGVAYKKSVME